MKCTDCQLCDLIREDGTYYCRIFGNIDSKCECLSFDEFPDYILVPTENQPMEVN